MKYGVLNKEYRQYSLRRFCGFFCRKSHYLRPKTHILGSLGTPESPLPPLFWNNPSKRKGRNKILKTGRHWSQGYRIKDPKYRSISIALSKKSYRSGWSGGFMFSNNQLALTIKWQGNRKTDCTINIVRLVREKLSVASCIDVEEALSGDLPLLADTSPHHKTPQKWSKNTKLCCLYLLLIDLKYF